ncbi:MAG: IMPACT family protein [Dethiobacteria bacterium]
MIKKMTTDFIFNTPKNILRRQFNEQGSKFIATLAPAETEEQAREIIFNISKEFPDATHHAYAYRICADTGLIERTSDDHEPAGTAGPPMLQVLQGNNISNAVVVATRYFGGTKLGIGGLTRAYRDCARLSIEDAVLVSREFFNSFLLRIAYEDYGAVTRLVEAHEGKIVSVEYTDDVTVTVTLPVRTTESFSSGFESTCRGRGKLTQI